MFNAEMQSGGDPDLSSLELADKAAMGRFVAIARALSATKNCIGTGQSPADYARKHKGDQA
jgi:hypothetical protein